ncbi:hypothetical protein BT93_B1169 [Corymbia citriodora subsp. variegata]|nr:hypothetical protein BT93_B1169 [Corymbia citriodora subsp. variegata]
MASSSKPKMIYDVFLSFRGTDLRKNFLGHLHKALNHNGIYTFLDSEELRKGDQITPALMKAIEESRIGIIVFSEDYASSPWCLEELTKIMECKEQRDLVVFPVFYKVEPKEVRTPRGSYNEAMVKHDSKFGKDSEKVKRWKKTLFDAGCLSGWHLNDGTTKVCNAKYKIISVCIPHKAITLCFRYLISELIQKIVKEISNHLDRKTLHIAKHPVGIYSQVVKLKSKLNLESNDGVLMVGLWGQGGIGKTSLAKALYNATFRQFEGSCFLAKVRETSKGSRGLVTLQEILLQKILLLHQRLEIFDVDEGINIIQHRLGCKKVLLILDDVDDLYQLNALVGEGKWFGNGSRIVITTRDKHLLTCHGIDQDHVCEVQALNGNEAHELLSKHAFLIHQKLNIRTDLVRDVLNYGKGLPLALEVLGSFLCARREYEWQSTLDRLSRIPNATINDVLKISYDGLEEDWKEIFLHIACFFKGKNCDYVKKVLDSCDLEATMGFNILTEKSLIRIESKILEMHDLIQLMGMDIKRSRLWLYDDVCNVLQHNKGNRAIKAIVLEPPELKRLSIHPKTFTKMRRLRLLIMHNVHNSFQGPMFLPNEVRWIEWSGCGFWNPHFSFGSKKLVGLDMSNCNTTGVVKQFKDFQQLTYIKLSNCESLVCTPNLSCAPNLKESKLWNCKNLVKAHESIAYHDKLQVLHLKWCPELCVFPNVLESKNLQDLNLSVCPKFEMFPDIPHEGLKKLSILQTAIKELLASIENLVSLEVMHLHIFTNPIHIPPNIYKLQKLQWLRSSFRPIVFPKLQDLSDPRMKIGLPNLNSLSLMNCNMFKVEFLQDLSCFPLLKGLYLSGKNITCLPASISKRDHLSELGLSGCHQLQEIPQLPPFLKSLHANECKSLQTNGHLTSIDQWVCRGLTMVDTASINKDSSCCIRLPRGEMPKWFQPIEEGSVSFMTSKELYDKFLGLVFCVVRGNKGNGCSLEFQAHFNGRSQGTCSKSHYKLGPSGSMLNYFPPSDLWKVVHFGQIDGSYAQFSLILSGGDVKELGFRIICKQLEDDLKVTLRDNKLIDLAFLYEVGHDTMDSEVKSLNMHEANSIKIGLLKNLQESSHMHENRPIKFDLDCGPSAYTGDKIGFTPNHEIFFSGGFPRNPNKKFKLILGE